MEHPTKKSSITQSATKMRALVRSKACKPPRKLKRFRELPAELRVKIWKYALPGRRIVRLHGVYHDPAANELTINDLHSTEHTLRYYPDFLTATADISMLSVCWESRLIALEAYPLSLASRYGLAEIRFNDQDILAFDQVWDVIASLRTARRLNLPIPQAISQIKTIGYYADRIRGGRFPTEYEELIFFMSASLDNFKSIFTGLEEFAVVADVGRNIDKYGEFEGFVREDVEGPDESMPDLILAAFIARGEFLEAMVPRFGTFAAGTWPVGCPRVEVYERKGAKERWMDTFKRVVSRVVSRGVRF